MTYARAQTNARLDHLESAASPSGMVVGDSVPVAKTFHIWVDAGAGYSGDIGALTQPTATPGAAYKNGGFTGLVRIRGSRSRFISIGIETGYQHLSSVSQQNAKAPGFGTTDISATLSAIPLMGIVTLEDYGILLDGGVGFYHLHSTATVFGNTISSGEWDMAFVIGLGAKFDLGWSFRLMPELQLTRINDQSRSLLAFLVRIELPLR
jgi:hypothetical protein